MTRFQVSKRDFSSEQLPQTEGVAEHVRLHGVACTLREDLRGHPAQVLHKHTWWRRQVCIRSSSENWHDESSDSYAHINTHMQNGHQLLAQTLCPNKGR